MVYTMSAADVPLFTEFVESGWEVTLKTENGEKFLE